MTVAVSMAAGQGAKAVICASTGNTSASAAAYAARAGLTCAVLVPRGKIALGKLAQALVHGARLLQVDGNFDDCLELARKLAADYPVALVNSVNPDRLEGQKTAAFEIVEALGDAPDVHCLPVGNAGNITAYWMGYREYAEGRAGRPGRRGCSASRPAGPRRSCGGEPVLAPVDHRDRDPDRQPGVLAAGRGGAGRLGRADRLGDRPPDPGRLPAAGRKGGGVRRAGVGGGGRRAAPGPGERAARRRFRVVCTITGNGLKDPDWAVSAAPKPVTVPVDAASRGRRAGAGLIAGLGGPRVLLGDQALTGRCTRCGFPRRAPTWDRVLTRSALRWGCYDQVEARVTGGGLAVAVSGEGEETAAAGERHLVVTAMRAAFARMGGQPPGIALRCANMIPHGRGLGSSAAAVVSGVLAARALVADGAGPPAGRGGVPARRGSRRAPRQRGGLPGGRAHRGAAAARACPTARARCAVTSRLDGAGAGALTGRGPCVARRHRGCATHRGAARRCPHRSRTPTRQPTPRAVRCWWPRSPATRQVLFDATEDFLHQRYRAAAMPPTADLLLRLRRAGVAAVVSGAGPSVLALGRGGWPAWPGGRGFNRAGNGYPLACNPPQGRPAGCHRPARRGVCAPAGAAWQGRSTNQAPEPGVLPAGGSTQGPGGKSGDTRTTVKGMPWARLVLSWLLHQVPRRRGRCSPVICRVTGCMVGCGR